MQTLAAALGNASTAKVTTVKALPSVLSNDTSGFAAALAAAKAADQVVLYLGIDGSVEGEGRDRTPNSPAGVGLPPTQIALAKAVLDACPTKKVVVVMINGGQLSIDWLSANAPAIVEAWYPGTIRSNDCLCVACLANHIPGYLFTTEPAGIYGGEAIAAQLFGVSGGM